MHTASASYDDRIDALTMLRNNSLKAFNEATAAAKGWPSETDCDSVKWAGIACAGGADVTISRAEYSPGEIQRRPDKACWTEKDGDQGAKSTTSRDQLTGYMACLWQTSDIGALQRLGAYGEAHGWMMGLPLTEPRVALGINLTGLLGRMIYALTNGDESHLYRQLSETYIPVAEDYEQHIQAISILFQGAVAEELRRENLNLEADLVDVTPGELERLNDLVAHSPQDALFQSILGVYTGNFSTAITLLLDPATPVPTYVRGDEPALFAQANWLLAANVVLRQFKGVRGAGEP